MSLTQKLYDLTVYFPYISSLFAIIGIVLVIILYRESGKERKWTENSYWIATPLIFALGCWVLSLGFIAVYGLFALFKWFGILGL